MVKWKEIPEKRNIIHTGNSEVTCSLSLVHLETSRNLCSLEELSLVLED